MKSHSIMQPLNGLVPSVGTEITSGSWRRTWLVMAKWGTNPFGQWRWPGMGLPCVVQPLDDQCVLVTTTIQALIQKGLGTQDISYWITRDKENSLGMADLKCFVLNEKEQLYLPMGTVVCWTGFATRPNGTIVTDGRAKALVQWVLPNSDDEPAMKALAGSVSLAAATEVKTMLTQIYSRVGADKPWSLIKPDLDQWVEKILELIHVADNPPTREPADEGAVAE